MKKIGLNLDALSVESFDVTGDVEEARGTVMANQQTLNVNCYTQPQSCHRTPCCPDTTFC
ncbi:MAG TPA: hypothetical protein VHG08_03930 [Longimicrobium sp.]|nr:hypothetical protein [Longimicrobium sp.]